MVNINHKNYPSLLSKLQVINYETRRGISVDLQRFGNSARSTLRIRNAQPSDSGSFSCEPSAAASASLALRVLNTGAEPMSKRSAAPQSDTSIRIKFTLNWWTLTLLLISLRWSTKR